VCGLQSIRQIKGSFQTNPNIFGKQNFGIRKLSNNIEIPEPTKL